MIHTDAIRRASMALNTAFNAEQVQAIIVAVEHLLDGYVRQVTAPPLPPDPSDEVGDETPAETAGKVSTTRKAK